MSTGSLTDPLYGQAGLGGGSLETPFAESTQTEWESEEPVSSLEERSSFEDEEGFAEDMVDYSALSEEQFRAAPSLAHTALAVPRPGAGPQPGRPVVPGRFYVRIVGAVQGPFAGDASQVGRAGWLVGRAFDQSSSVPRDVQTGQASGKRVHSPIVVTLDWSAASPQIFMALVNNEALPTVTIEFVGTGADGAERAVQRVTLTNAGVSALHRVAGSTSPAEQVSLAFQKIELEDLTAGKTAVDDWTREVEGAPEFEYPGEPSSLGEIGGFRAAEAGPLEAGEIHRPDAWVTDTYEPQRGGLKPCIDESRIA